MIEWRETFHAAGWALQDLIKTGLPNTFGFLLSRTELIISFLSIYYIVALHLQINKPFGIDINNQELLTTLVALIGFYLATDDIITSGEITTELKQIAKNNTTTSEAISARLNHIDEHVLRARTGEYFTNFRELWSRITHLATQADNEVLVTVSNDQFVPARDWYDNLAKLLKQVYEHSQTHLRYELVIDTTKDTTHIDCQTALRNWTEWKNSLPEYARDFVQLVFRKTLPLAFTAVIIDHKHVCICFVSTGKGHTDTGLVFENSGELGARMATWFNLQFSGDLQKTNARSI